MTEIAGFPLNSSIPFFDFALATDEGGEKWRHVDGNYGLETRT